jgi:hypothetical protein
MYMYIYIQYLEEIQAMLDKKLGRKTDNQPKISRFYAPRVKNPEQQEMSRRTWTVTTVS